MSSHSRLDGRMPGCTETLSWWADCAEGILPGKGQMTRPLRLLAVTRNLGAQPCRPEVSTRSYIGLVLSCGKRPRCFLLQMSRLRAPFPCSKLWPSSPRETLPWPEPPEAPEAYYFCRAWLTSHCGHFLHRTAFIEKAFLSFHPI